METFLGGLASAIFGALIGAGIGGRITYRVSKSFYMRAANDLATRTGLVFRALQEGGVAEFTYDESGEAIGLVRHLKASITVTAKVIANPDVVKGESSG